jgi:alkylhydroperoxidase/carboxymuconolactone decarboxylase family protein YurZ
MASETFDALKARLSAREIPTMRWGELFYEYDPEMYEAYANWTSTARQHVELEPKVREMIGIAIDCVVMWPSPGIDYHFHRALEEGATLQELADVVLATGRMMGPHSYSHGFSTLERVVEERAAKGLPTRRRRADRAGDGESDE